MAGTLWIPGAERLKPSSPGGTITSKLDPRVVWHTTEAPSGDPEMFGRMDDVLTGKGDEPHVLWDPITDRLGQYFALNLSGRALQNDGGTRTNRTGLVCIQIEVIGYAAHPFTDTWKPGPNFRALMAAIRSWDIPDLFPMGRPPKYPGGSTRDREIWLTEGGHYCHANIPGNSHGDPGAISPSALFAAAGKPTTTTPEDDVLNTADKNWIEANNQKYANAVNTYVRQVLGTTSRALVAAVQASDKTQADRILAEVDKDAADLSAKILADTAEVHQ